MKANHFADTSKCVHKKRSMFVYPFKPMSPQMRMFYLENKIHLQIMPNSTIPVEMAMIPMLDRFNTPDAFEARSLPTQWM